MILRSDALEPLTRAEYSPRRGEYLAHPWLLWTNVGTNLLVIISYVLFIIGITWLLRKLSHTPQLRRSLWILWTLNIFFFARCATTILATLKLWWPLYNLSVIFNVVCAVTSIPAAIAFLWHTPALAVSILRFFNLLATEQDRADTLRASEEFLDRTSRLAAVGGWEINLGTNEVTWSTETHRILGAPLGFEPTLAEALDMYKPEARHVIISAVETASAGGDGFDLELPVDCLDGREIWARVVGAVEIRDGSPVRLTGAFQDITERVESRNALKQANERIEIATDSGGIGIWDWDVVTGNMYCDDWMHRLHGKDPKKPCEDTLWRDHLHPDDKERVISLLNEALEGVRPYEAEFRILWPDGSVHHLRASARVARSETGQPIRMVGVNWDITEQVEARNDLRLANERVTLAADSGGIGIFEWDLLDNTCTCDDWMYRLHNLEKTSETTPLTFWTQHMHPDDIPLVMAALNAAVTGPEPYDTEYRVVWDDGSVHHLRATGRLARDHNGLAISMIGANWDVTESRRLTSELAEQHELLSVTLQAIGDGVISKDIHRNIVLVNHAAELMSGWQAAEAVGRSVTDVFKIVQEETRLSVDIHIDKNTAASRRVGASEHVLLVARDGTERFIESLATPIYNAQRVLVGSVLVFRDVTEQRRLAAETERNAQLSTQLKLKDEFLSHVSHELRSPLSSIYSFTSIISDGLAGETSPEQNDYLHIILKNVSQLQSMIEDLLTVTQSREGKLTVELQSVSVPDAILDAIHTVQGAAASKNIVLSSDKLSQLPPALADPTRLQQILIILLDNAVKFTPVNGRVTVSASVREETLLTFQVSDTGCGIPLDKRILVFENLYQVRGPGQADTSHLGRTGLGLGLHIARNLIIRQGGNIWITEAAGGGSTFNFTLPIFTESAYLAAIARNKQQDHPRRRKDDLPLGVRKPTLAA